MKRRIYASQTKIEPAVDKLAGGVAVGEHDEVLNDGHREASDDVKPELSAHVTSADPAEPVL